MGKDTRDNRERLINLCLGNGLKLNNTFFQQEAEEKVTYRPLSVGRKEKITEETHDQIDYIMSRERDNIRISNCRTDTRAKIESRRYPLIAELPVQFATL